MKIKVSGYFNILPQIDSANINKVSQAAFTTLERLFPEDLYDVIEKKGHRFHDDLTKLALYSSLKIFNQKGVECSDRKRLGVILATRYGNFTQGLKINRHSQLDESKFSAQLFPNSTFSSSAVIVSIKLAAQGVNLTLDSGDLGAIAAINLAKNYIDAGSIDQCLIIAGDDYHDFTAKHYENQLGYPLNLYSGVAAMLLSRESKKHCEQIIFSDILSDSAQIEKYFDDRLDSNWRKNYLVHVEGIKSLKIGTEKFNYINETHPSFSLGPLTTLNQYALVKKINRSNKIGAIIITTAVDEKVGVCVINYAE